MLNQYRYKSSLCLAAECKIQNLIRIYRILSYFQAAKIFELLISTHTEDVKTSLGGALDRQEVAMDIELHLGNSKIL